MSNICQITGKRRLRGNRVSHANNKTIHFQEPNIKERSILVPELGVRVKVKVSPSGLRTLDKVGGLSRFLLKADAETLSPKLRAVQKNLLSRA